MHNAIVIYVLAFRERYHFETHGPPESHIRDFREFQVPHGLRAELSDDLFVFQRRLQVAGDHVLPGAYKFLKTPQFVAPIQVELSQEKRVRLIRYDGQCVLGDVRAKLHTEDPQLAGPDEQALKPRVCKVHARPLLLLVQLKRLPGMRDPYLRLEELAYLLYLELFNRRQICEDLENDLGVHIPHLGRDTTHPVVCTKEK